MLACLEEDLVKLVTGAPCRPPGGHLQGTRPAAIGVRAPRAGLGALEIGQAMGVVPVRGARLFGPAVEVAGMATNIDHAVDRGRTAQALAAWRIDPSPGKPRLGLALELPSIARIVHRVEHARGHVDEDRIVASARLDQQYRNLRVLTQPVGQHAACRARAHNDVIEGLNRRHAALRSS